MTLKKFFYLSENFYQILSLFNILYESTIILIKKVIKTTRKSYFIDIRFKSKINSRKNKRRIVRIN